MMSFCSIRVPSRDPKSQGTLSFKPFAGQPAIQTVLLLATPILLLATSSLLATFLTTKPTMSCQTKHVLTYNPIFPRSSQASNISQSLATMLFRLYLEYCLEYFTFSITSSITFTCLLGVSNRRDASGDQMELGGEDINFHCLPRPGGLAAKPAVLIVNFTERRQQVVAVIAFTAEKEVLRA